MRAAPPVSESDSESIDERSDIYDSSVETYIGGDFDGCLSHEFQRSETSKDSVEPLESPAEKLVNQNRSLSTYFAAFNVKGFLNASSRQCPDLEEENTRKSRLIVKAWFPVIKQFAARMGWPLIPWFVTDIFTEARTPGDTLERFLANATKKFVCPIDLSKLLIVFGQVEYIANERNRLGLNGKFIYSLIDDRDDILSRLHGFLSLNPDLVPKEVQIHFLQYKGNEVTRRHVLQGAGEVYEDYERLMKGMVAPLQGQVSRMEPFELINKIQINRSASGLTFSLVRPPILLDDVFGQPSDDECEESKEKILPKNPQDGLVKEAPNTVVVVRDKVADDEYVTREGKISPNSPRNAQDGRFFSPCFPSSPRSPSLSQKESCLPPLAAQRALVVPAPVAVQRTPVSTRSKRGNSLPPLLARGSRMPSDPPAPNVPAASLSFPLISNRR